MCGLRILGDFPLGYNADKALAFPHVDEPFRHVRKSAQKDSIVVAERPGSVGMVGYHFAYRIVPDGMAVEQGNHRASRGCKRIEECHAKAVLLCANRLTLYWRTQLSMKSSV
jgi:hypothetical protein